ncbi:hypothetical protein GUITHDRAFT_158664 [Guillardia theta CCMP2712]|uniref:Bystin n=2 Tax=Guillardia theta TaxID=55529 RepID=L1IKB1_GUITC|nr:hypothetical protein GUITHDRAFT_158664 [Guillardia theta CCMP2712]EKX36557.1 hypothetical protein GUITHDRAFT_158664 [Guillardia theta CCMP2712]|eukprot:XP_005823537.1 hypothetical protein GUITHDRAFT_158664 [Guillardia theta CCMP2712]
MPQPRKNQKKPLKSRIFKKLRKAEKEENDKDDDAVEEMADSKVMKQAQLQALELKKEDFEDGGDEMGAEEEDNLEYDSDDAQSQFTATSGIDDYEQYIKEEQQITEEEEEAFNLFLKPRQGKVKTIADLIEEKMRERQTTGEDVEMEELGYDDIDPKVVEVYKNVGKLLSRYKSGKLPKALKVVPSLSNWEQIVWIMEPEAWSNHAYYACTRIFASCLQDQMAQRFYNLVLLPRVIDDLKQNKRLNYHLYQALKKCCYKPAAFYKGIVLPICDSGSCTLREATVLSSVIKKVSIPVLHSSAALLRLAMSKVYTGSESIFIKTLLDKKYALPYRVIDAVVEHFVQFKNETRELPVKWHQSLLVFSQRYKNNLSAQQKEGIKQVMRVHSHYAITPEIRRELFSQQSQRLDQIMP